MFIRITDQTVMATGHVKLVADLRRSIERKQLLAIVGAGLSIHATHGERVASWRGLLRSGIEWCQDLAQDSVFEWANRMDAALSSDKLEDWLRVAESVCQELGGPAGGEYRRWLRETVGRLRPRRVDALSALRDLDIPIATTNYDSLIEQVTGWEPVTWMDPPAVERVLRGDDRRVLHLHGHWEQPESVILGKRSYEQVLRNPQAQHLLRTLRSTYSLVFIGFGSGLCDPNFDALFKWAREIFAGSEYRHYRLVLKDEAAEVRRLHPKEDRIFVIPFGHSHDDLAAFLSSLRAPPAFRAPYTYSDAVTPGPLGAPELGHQWAQDLEENARRRLDCARQAVPNPVVIGSFLEHVLPAAETSALLAIPGLLASILHLHPTFSFRANATQTFQSVLVTILMHELCHHARPGEEGAAAAHFLRGGHRGRANVGQLILSDVDHPAIQHIARTIWGASASDGARRGGTVVCLRDLVTGAPEDPTRRIAERFLDAIAKGDTCAVLVPHVTWHNGAQIDIASLCERLRREHPLLTTIVDGAQAVGHIPLEFETPSRENMNIDFYIGCGHKWLGGPEAVGFVRVGQRYRDVCEACRDALAAGDLFMDGTAVSIRFVGEQSGTNHRGLARAFALALELFTDWRRDGHNPYQLIFRNAESLRAIAREFRSLSVLDPPRGMKTGIVSLTPTEGDEGLLKRLERALTARGYVPALYPGGECTDGKSFLRLSPGPYLSADHLEAIEGVFREVLL